MFIGAEIHRKWGKFEAGNAPLTFLQRNGQAVQAEEPMTAQGEAALRSIWGPGRIRLLLGGNTSEREAEPRIRAPFRARNPCAP